MDNGDYVMKDGVPYLVVGTLSGIKVRKLRQVLSPLDCVIYGDTVELNGDFVRINKGTAIANAPFIKVFTLRLFDAMENKQLLSLKVLDGDIADKNAIAGVDTSRKGMSFLGWHLDSEDSKSKEFVLNSTPVKKDIDVYGFWKKESK